MSWHCEIYSNDWTRVSYIVDRILMKINKTELMTYSPFRIRAGHAALVPTAMVCCYYSDIRDCFVYALMRGISMKPRGTMPNHQLPSSKKKNRYEKSYDKSSKVECMLFSNTLCAHLTYIRHHHATTTATTIIIVTMISTTIMIMIIMIIIIIKNNNRNHHWWQQKNRRFWMQIKVRWWFPAFPALLLLCEGKPWSSVVSPCNGRVTRIFDV